MITEAIVSESDLDTYFYINLRELLNKYRNECSRVIQMLFNEATEKQPSLIVLDEIDATKNDNENNVHIREEIIKQLSKIRWDMKCKTDVIALTNKPWDLSPMIRIEFSMFIYICLPEQSWRKEIFKIHTRNIENNLSDQDYNILSQKTDGFSGRDIVKIVQTAAYFKGIYNDNNNEKDYKVKPEILCLKHFMNVLQNAQPSIDGEEIQKFFNWQNEHFNSSYGLVE